MRRFTLPAVLALGAALSVPADVALAGEAVRTLRAELTGSEASRFAIENLVGTMEVTEGTGAAIEIVATVHAETSELADAVRLEKVGDGAVRVRYPYDRVSTFQYREPSSYDGFVGWSSSDSYDYDGHRVKVNRGRGTSLYADLDVRVPKGRVEATFSNLVGLVDATGLTGTLAFRVRSADLRLRRLEGTITLEGSSGDIRARDIKGSWSSEFASGDCDIAGFEGESLSFHTTSGDVVIRSLKARRAEFVSTSGDIRLTDATLQELSAEASSGDVTFEAAGDGLRDVRIRTSSGDVALRLPVGMAFDVDADQSSGDMDVRFTDGTEISHRDRVVGYRHGTGGARIHVHTSSGDLMVSPG